MRADVLGRRVPVVLAHHAALHQREVATAGLARAVGRRSGLGVGVGLGVELGLGLWLWLGVGVGLGLGVRG